MKCLSTAREKQRTDFVDSLYKSLRKKTEIAFDNHNKMCALASSYLEEGLDPQECAELLIIEGNISRDAALSYVSMVEVEKPVVKDNKSGENEYSFQFDDVHGRVWSSRDIGMTITASSDEEAWEKAEEAIYTNVTVEPDKIISVDRIA